MNDNGADQSARKLGLPAPFLFTCNKVRPILGFLDLCEPNYYSNSIMLLAFADIKKKIQKKKTEQCMSFLIGLVKQNL